MYESIYLFTFIDIFLNHYFQRCLEINGFKTFELGKCKKCNQIYIIGKIEGNHLRQNTNLDIYENVDEGQHIPVDYFIINKDEADIDMDEVSKYVLCTRCGHIHEANETNPEFCSCGEEYRINVYKVLKDKSDEKKTSSILYNNNITYCPCCGKSSNNGIVSSFYLRKDATTAVLTQILLKAIDKSDDDLELDKNENYNPFLEPKKQKKYKNYVKQLLEFSDGRQQASFAATFCEYNHERFLRKKLLYNYVRMN